MNTVSTVSPGLLFGLGVSFGKSANRKLLDLILNNPRKSALGLGAAGAATAGLAGLGDEGAPVEEFTPSPEDDISQKLNEMFEGYEEREYPDYPPGTIASELRDALTPSGLSGINQEDILRYAGHAGAGAGLGGATGAALSTAFDKENTGRNALLGALLGGVGGLGVSHYLNS